MAKHPGLNDATRSARMATYSKQDDLDYFAAHVKPALEEYYAELTAQNKVPFCSTLDDAMSWVLNTAYTRGRMVRSDPSAFINPVLNHAHKKGGIAELRECFDELVVPYTKSYVEYIDSFKDDLDKLTAIHNKVDTLAEEGKAQPSPLKALANMIEMKVTGRLSAEFNRTQQIDQLTAQAAAIGNKMAEVNTGHWGYARFYPGVYGFRKNASEDRLAEIAKRHENGTLVTVALDHKDPALPKPAHKFPDHLIPH